MRARAWHSRTARPELELAGAPAARRHPLLDLQRSVGNRTVSALVAASRGSTPLSVQRGVGSSRMGAPAGLEMGAISVRKRLESRDYVLQNSPYPGMMQLVGTRAHVLTSSLAPNYAHAVAFGDLVTDYLDHGLELFRGIPKWHQYWIDAYTQGIARPFGAGPPDFDTQRSRFLPFSEAEDIAAYAAHAESGASHANRPKVGLGDVPGHRHHNPDEVVGVVLRVDVDLAAPVDIAFLKPGEVQLGGPVQAHVHRVLRAAASRDWRRREGVSAEV